MSAPTWQIRLLERLGRLPPSRRDAAARLLYGLIYHGAGYRRPLVRQNLQRAFPRENGTGLTKMEKMFYRRLADVALEIAQTASMTPAAMREAVQLDNPDLVHDYSRNFSTPVLLLALHHGNWEWLLSGTALGLGMPLDVIYKPLHNRALNDFMGRVRSRFGCRAIPVSAAPVDLLRHRRQPRLLAMAADQAPTSGERRLSCQFFGMTTDFHHAPAEFAARTGTPVLFAALRRRSPGRYSVHFQPLTPPQGGADAAAITRAYASAAERVIRDAPADWLWSHRRWKGTQVTSSQPNPPD